MKRLCLNLSLSVEWGNIKQAKWMHYSILIMGLAKRFYSRVDETYTEWTNNKAHRPYVVIGVNHASFWVNVYSKHGVTTNFKAMFIRFYNELKTKQTSFTAG